LQQPGDDLEPIEPESDAIWRMVVEDRMGLMQRTRASYRVTNRTGPRRRPSRRPPEVAREHVTAAGSCSTLASNRYG
jgi:hypothetical protein